MTMMATAKKIDNLLSLAASESGVERNETRLFFMASSFARSGLEKEILLY